MIRTGVVPFLTYDFSNRQQIQVQPFITYANEIGINEKVYPFITYIASDKTKKSYYLCLYSSITNKTARCKLYNNTDGFPLKDVHISVLCEDGKRRYAAIDYVNNDFDSGAKCEDEYGHIYQICLGRQDNLIYKHFRYGNLLIPLDNYNDLYTILAGIFGVKRVQMDEDGILFTCPPASSGITKLFLVGLNISIETAHNHLLTTYANGLNHTSFGGDEHWTANSMMVKLVPYETIRIRFSNSYMGWIYRKNILVKNSIIIGDTVEHLDQIAASYEPLIRTRKWFLYDTKHNKINVTYARVNETIAFLKDNYLQYQNSGRMYNYYDLKNIETVQKGR